MNEINNLIFDFLNLNQKQIIKLSSLSYFLYDTEIENKEVKIKNRKVKEYIISLKLNENIFLLLKDFPINILLNYTILIGDKTKLYKFNLKTNPQYTYIGTNEIINELKQEVQINTITQINPKEILNYTFNIFKPKIIQEYKQYIQNKKNINLDKFHLVQSEKIEFFNPNFKNRHLKLALKLNLPVIKLIKNNFIRESTINIFDFEYFKKILNPIKILEKEEKIPIYKKDPKEKIYKEITKDYYLLVNTKQIIKILKNYNNTTNFNIKNTIKEIEKINKVKLTTQNKTKYPFPLWYYKDEIFIPNNIFDFKERTGIEYENNFQKLKKIFILTKYGTQAQFSEKYLKQKIIQCISSFENDIENKIITFRDEKELILKLNYFLNKKQEFEKIIKIEKIPKTLKEQNYLFTKKITDILILLIIKYNKIPKYNKEEIKQIIENNNTQTLYLYNIYNELFEIYLKYVKKKQIYELIKTNNNYLQTIFNFLTQNKKYLTKNDIFPISQIINIQLKILEIYNFKKKELIKKILSNFIKDYSIKPINTLKNKTLKNYIELQIQFEKIIKNNIKNKNKYFLLIKKKEEFENYKLKNNKNQNILYCQTIIKTYKIKPNVDKIKKTFPFNFIEIIYQINHLNSKEIIVEKIKLEENPILLIKLKNDKKIKLTKEFFYFKTLHSPKYKIIYENNIGKILKEI